MELDTENSDSETSENTISFFANISEKEQFELDETIYETIEQYMDDELIHYSSSTFIKTMQSDITHIIFQNLLNSELCEDSHYDEIYDYVCELISIHMEFVNLPPRSNAIMTPSALTKSELANIIRKLQNTEQPAQRTPEWYQFRYNLITASNLWKAFASEAQQNSLIYEKCKPLDVNSGFKYSNNTSSTLHWGNKYEPVTIAIYDTLYNTKVGDFGCIRHPLYSWIGASPDGINIDPESPRFGRMVEVKNIVNREITGIPIDAYWIQTQVQMETCGLDRCDLIETRLYEYPSETEFYSDEDHELKGVILYFIKREVISMFDNNINNDSSNRNHNFINIQPLESTPIYKFMPMNILQMKPDIDAWIEKTKEENKQELVLFETIYWYLDEMLCTEIQYNPMWMNAAFPKI
jgi:hypothetical protein